MTADGSQQTLEDARRCSKMCGRPAQPELRVVALEAGGPRARAGGKASGPDTWTGHVAGAHGEFDSPDLALSLQKWPTPVGRQHRLLSPKAAGGPSGASPCLCQLPASTQS